MIKKKTQHMLMEIQFLAWDWYKHVSGSILKNEIKTLRILATI